MPYELVFTSAPRGANIGSSGYCTVAQTNDMGQDITLALEKTGVYHHVAGPGSGSNPTVYSYRILDIRGETYYVLSQIRDSGLDYTNRSNYLAHHLVFDSREIDNLPSPAVILWRWNGWINSWGDNPPGPLPPERFTQTGLYELQKTQGFAENWQKKTGDAANAARLMEYPPSQPVYWSCNVDEELEMVQLFAEALQLADPTGKSFIEAWNYTFTTFLQQGEQPGQFVWRGVVPDTPAFQAALQSGHVPQPLAGERVSDPESDRSKFAKTGQPQAHAAQPMGTPPTSAAVTDAASLLKQAPSPSEAVAGVVSRLTRTLSGGGLISPSNAKKKKRAVTSGKSKPSGKRKVKDPSRKWIFLGGGIIGVCVLVVLIYGAWSIMFDGDNGGTAGKHAKSQEGGADNGDGGEGRTDITTLLGGSTGGETAGKNKNGNGTGGKAKPPAPAKANPKLYEFMQKSRVYLMPTKAGQLGIPSNHSELKEDSPLGTFFKALKAHNSANFAIKENPAPFETATYAVGPDPMKLRGDRPIPYVSEGGTQAKPVQYDLGPMAVLASALNPASKPAGIYFQFPEHERLWIHIKGKGIEPFYVVPYETGRYPAPFILKVAQGVVFDDGSMTARVNSGITKAITKLLKDNKASPKIMLRAGAPLATWGLAHKNTAATIDFKKLHVEPQIAAANAKLKHLNHFSTLTDNALKELFPAAEKAFDANAKMKNDPDVEAHKNAIEYMEKTLRKAHRVMRRNYKWFKIKALPQFVEVGRRNDIDPIVIMENNELFMADNEHEIQDPEGNDIVRSEYIINICKEYFEAAEAVRTVSARRNKDGKLKKQTLELQRLQAAYAQNIALYSRAGSPVPGLDAHKETLANEAAQIFLGKSSAADTNKKWQEKKENIAKVAKAEAKKWNDKMHQKAEWERFKQHQVFFLAGTIGMGGQPAPLVQFNQ